MKHGNTYNLAYQDLVRYTPNDINTLAKYFKLPMSMNKHQKIKHIIHHIYSHQVMKTTNMDGFKCSNDVDYFTLMEFDDDQPADMKIKFIDEYDTKQNKIIKSQVVCYNKEIFDKWLYEDNNYFANWVEKKDQTMDNEGYGGKAGHERILALPDRRYIMGYSLLQKTGEYYAIPLVENYRIGNTQSLFSISGIHGQAPGYTIYGLFPKNDNLEDHINTSIETYPYQDEDIEFYAVNVEQEERSTIDTDTDTVSSFEDQIGNDDEFELYDTTEDRIDMGNFTYLINKYPPRKYVLQLFFKQDTMSINVDINSIINATELKEYPELQIDILDGNKKTINLFNLEKIIHDDLSLSILTDISLENDEEELDPVTYMNINSFVMNGRLNKLSLDVILTNTIHNPENKKLQVNYLELLFPFEHEESHDRYYGLDHDLSKIINIKYVFELLNPQYIKDGTLNKELGIVDIFMVRFPDPVPGLEMKISENVVSYVKELINENENDVEFEILEPTSDIISEQISQLVQPLDQIDNDE